MGGVLLGCLPALYAQSVERPNIIFILADDMGYGDIAVLNENGKVPTPNLDRLSSEGATFLDAHASTSVSSPSRYSILTGRYNWRSRLKGGALPVYHEPLMDPQRTTMPSMLRNQGYQTACIGKWHLGMKFATTDGKAPRDTETECNLDFHKEIKGGPCDVGFDYFFGVDCPNFPPYCFLENRKTVGIPSLYYPAREGIIDSRGGHGVKNWNQEQVLPTVIDKATHYVKEASKSKKPFFLYLSLTSPHTPIVPTSEFEGKTGLNAYTDFVMQTDAGVGKVLDALKENGIEDNTLVVFSADNGCCPLVDVPFLQKKGHDPSYIYRGLKSDLYEGGHRMPCMVKWPGHIRPHQVKQTICLVDFMATFAHLTGYALADNEAEDSYNLTPLLLNEVEPAPIRATTVHYSSNGYFAIRQGKWKLLLCNFSGGWTSPTLNHAYKERYQLYDLEKDPGENNNLYAKYPEKVEELRLLLVNYIKDGRTTPGIPQRNDPVKEWKQLSYWMSAEELKECGVQ